MTTTNGTHTNSQSHSAQLLERLNEPQTAEALNKLLDNAELLAFSVSAVDGLIRRSESIANNIAGSVGDIKQLLPANGAQYTEKLPQLLEQLPQLIELSTQLTAITSTSEFKSTLKVLGDPTTLTALNSLLSNIELVAFLVTAIDGLLRRGDTLADNLRASLHDTGLLGAGSQLDLGNLSKTLSQIRPLLPRLVTVAPKLVELTERLEPFVASPEFDALLDSGIFDPATVRVLGGAGDALAASYESSRQRPRQMGLIGLVHTLLDRDVRRALAFLADFAHRFTPFVGTSYEPGLTLSGKPVEVYAIYGGQWPHSSFMIPGGVMCGPTLSDVTRSIAILEQWHDDWLEKIWLGCSVDRWLDNKSWADVMAWMDENESHYNSDCALFIRFCMDVGLDKLGAGVGTYLAMGTYFQPELYTKPTIDGRNDALISRSGIYDGEGFHDFDQARVSEDHTYSFFRGSGSLHPFDGVTDAIDPAEGKKQGKYTWAKAPRYNVPNRGSIPLEAGPLARQVIAGREGAAGHQDYDPLFLDAIKTTGASVMVRVMARMHEAAKYYRLTRRWLDELDLHGKFYIKPTEYAEGQGFGATEAARGALADWIKIKDGKIENYQVVTPTAWNIGPRDGNKILGPVEHAFVGLPIHDMEDPVELAHVARSFDSCLVCTVHAYDKKTGKELTRFKVNGAC